MLKSASLFVIGLVVGHLIAEEFYAAAVVLAFGLVGIIWSTRKLDN